MGNNKFRLSDMIPNAWFHKHKVTKTRDPIQNTPPSSQSYSSSSSSSFALASAPNQCPNNITNLQPHLSDPRKSYRFTRDLSTHFHKNSQILKTKLLLEPPRKSSRRRSSTKKNRPLPNPPPVTVSAGCSCRATLESARSNPPDSTPEQYPNSSLDQTFSSELDSMFNEYGSEQSLTPDTFDRMLSLSTSCKCRVQNDIVLDIGTETSELRRTVPELAPIITKNHQKTNVQRTWTHSSSPGFKLRTNSPRIANRRIQGGRKSVAASNSSSRRGVYESYAVVKSSKDPRRDFRESMVEMIVENNIMGSSKDLEELLACYLSLNSDEYHDIIITVFKQIWFDFIHVSLK